jgi:hypothetical protein
MRVITYYKRNKVVRFKIIVNLFHFHINKLQKWYLIFDFGFISNFIYFETTKYYIKVIFIDDLFSLAFIFESIYLSTSFTRHLHSSFLSLISFVWSIFFQKTAISSILVILHSLSLALVSLFVLFLSFNIRFSRT